MLKPEPTLHLVCGKVAAGKSTLANCLASAPATALISEDHWLLRMCPGEISFLEDHARCSARLGEVKEDHVQALLGTGQSVVMDFPANTLSQRQRLRKIFKSAGFAHQLHFLAVPDTVCKARLRQRNQDGVHNFGASEAEFNLFTSYFVTRSPEEGFNVTIYVDL